jgi:hypothetical protein
LEYMRLVTTSPSTLPAPRHNRAVVANIHSGMAVDRPSPGAVPAPFTPSGTSSSLYVHS